MNSSKVQTNDEKLQSIKNTTKVPNPIINYKNISVQARFLWIELWKYCWGSGNNKAWPGMEKIAKNLDVTENTIRNYRKELEEENLLTVDHLGLGKTNRYYLHYPDPKKVKDPDPKKSKDQTLKNPRIKGEKSEGSHSKKDKGKKDKGKKDKNKPSDKSDNSSQDQFSISKLDNGRYDYPEDYERVYSLYPANNGSKKSGWRKWASLRRKEVAQEDIVETVKNYAKVCQVEDTSKKYTKHLSTFFGPDDHWREYLGGNFDLSDYKDNDKKEDKSKGCDKVLEASDYTPSDRARTNNEK